MDYERPCIPIRLTSPHSLALASPFHFSPFLLLEQTLFSIGPVIRQLCAPFLYSITSGDPCSAREGERPKRESL